MIPLMPAVTIGARPELVAVVDTVLAAEFAAPDADASIELSAALCELRREESLALSVAA